MPSTPWLLLIAVFVAGCTTSGPATDLHAQSLRYLMEPCTGEPCGAAVVLVESAETGEPLPGANVAAVALGVGAATSDEGVAVVQQLPAGPVTFRVDFIGFKRAEVTMEVPDGGLVVQRARLEPDTVNVVY